MNPAPDWSPLVNIYGEVFLCREQLGCDGSSWLFAAHRPPLTAAQPCAGSEERSLLTGASRHAPQLCTLPFLFFLLPFEITTGLLFVASHYFAVVFIINWGKKSAVTSVSCCVNVQPRASPQPLCVSVHPRQAAVNRLALFYSLGRSEGKKVTGRDQNLVKLSLHLILSTACLQRIEGTFCYSASWFPSTGASLPFYVIRHIPFCAVITIKFKYR